MAFVAAESMALTCSMSGLILGGPAQHFRMRSPTTEGHLGLTVGLAPSTNTARSNLLLELMPANGLEREQISHRRMPNEYTSAGREYPVQSPTSDAMSGESSVRCVRDEFEQKDLRKRDDSQRGVPHLSKRSPEGFSLSFLGRPEANPKSNS